VPRPNPLPETWCKQRLPDVAYVKAKRSERVCPATRRRRHMPGTGTVLRKHGSTETRLQGCPPTCTPLCAFFIDEDVFSVIEINRYRPSTGLGIDNPARLFTASAHHRGRMLPRLFVKPGEQHGFRRFVSSRSISKGFCRAETQFTGTASDINGFDQHFSRYFSRIKHSCTPSGAAFRVATHLRLRTIQPCESLRYIHHELLSSVQEVILADSQVKRALCEARKRAVDSLRMVDEHAQGSHGSLFSFPSDVQCAGESTHTIVTTYHVRQRLHAIRPLILPFSSGRHVRAKSFPSNASVCVTNYCELRSATAGESG